jgi:tryptophan synthase alpha chain
MSAPAQVSGAERISDAFVGHGKQAALMPYVLGGYPSLQLSREIGHAYVDAGADLIELGFPYSDPLADGPILQAAGGQALANGTTLSEVIEIGRELGERVPVVLMTYTNVLLSRGVERVAGELSKAGISGLIAPDLPLLQAAEFRAAFDAAGVAVIPLVAPTTPDERMREIGAVARGFLYTVAVTGTTGERAELQSGIADVIARARAATEVPVALGFGISTPEHASEAARLGAQGVIVASRLVREAGEAEDPVAAVGAIVGEFAAALKS